MAGGLSRCCPEKAAGCAGKVSPGAHLGGRHRKQAGAGHAAWGDQGRCPAGALPQVRPLLNQSTPNGGTPPQGDVPHPTPPHPAFPIRTAAPARAHPMEHLPHPEHPLSQPRQAPARSAPRWALPRIGAPLPYAGKPDGDHAPPEPARPAGQPPVSRGLCSGTPPPAGAAPTAPNGSGSPPGAPPARAPP